MTSTASTPRVALIAIATALASLLAATSASADSIVYTKDYNVWLINPDGSGEYQVTTDGTSARGYYSASQADDGTIAAIRDTSPVDKLVRMRQNGEVLSEFTPEVAATGFANGLFDAAISPDGQKIAYRTAWFGDGSCNLGTSGGTPCYIFAVSAADGPENLGAQPFRKEPSWIDNSTLLVETDSSRMATYTLSADPDQDEDSVDWFGKNFNDGGLGDPVYDGEVSPDGAKIATATWTSTFFPDPPGHHHDSLVLWTTNGPPPAAPTPRCRFRGAAGDYFEDPSWAEDGTAVVWEEGDNRQDTPPTGDEGIWIVRGDVATTDCAELDGGLLVRGGAEPDWGPAPINPGPRSPGADSGSGDGGPGGSGGGGGGGGGGGSRGGGGSTSTTPTTPTTDTTGPRITVTVRGQRLRTVLKKGYAVGFDSNEPGSATGSLRASGSAARGLKVTVAKTATVASGKSKFASAGRQKVVLKFTRKARKKLARKRSLKLTLRMTVADAAGNKSTQTRRVTLKR
jgi:uncharacterized membrane protein YgcG